MELWMRDVAAVSTSFVAVLFVYAGIAKILSRRAFARDLLLVPYLPRSLSRFVAMAIPVFELVIGGGLLFGMAWAKIAAMLALSLFSIVALVAHVRDQKVPCNCFGADLSEQLSLATIARNVALVGVMAATLHAAGSQSPILAGTYGLIAFLLFLGVSTARANARDFREALRWRHLA